MRVSNERTPYLQELIRLSSEATLIIPSIVFDDEMDDYNKFEDFRNAFNWLQNDEKLIVTLNKVNNDFNEVNIRIRDGENG